MQLRSQLQHAWATAVETVGTFLRQALKSSLGEDIWLRFFALMGSAIALRERAVLVPGTPLTKQTLIAELRTVAQELDVVNKLATYTAVVQHTAEDPSAKQADAHYYLLTLDTTAGSVTIQGFTSDELRTATEAYLHTERAISGRHGADAVLVSVESLSLLRRAYPNYFLDTGVFVNALKQALA